jgi:hypothetical protein
MQLRNLSKFQRVTIHGNYTMHKRTNHLSLEKRIYLKYLNIFSVSPLRWDKMLPRDNKMYFVSEGYNIDPTPEPSIV